MNTTSHGIDTYISCTAKAADIAKTKTFVMRYYYSYSQYKEPFTHEEAVALSKAGIYIGVMWENGRPTTDAYFTTARALQDALGALAEAKQVGQPAGTVIYFTVDCDDEQVASIKAYFQVIHDHFDNSGFTVGVYGSGLVCKALKTAGFVTHTWLSQSYGFPEYHEWLPFADIVQGPVTKFLSMDVDLDIALGNSGCWRLAV